MRTEKELWELVLSRQDLFTGGLCTWIGDMRILGLITEEEWDLISNSVYAKRIGKKIYWIGPEFEIQPRIDWINERIKEL